jgi:hypothetical protein
MNKILSILILSLFIQIICEFKIYDGSRLKELSYYPDENYNASIPVSMENFDQEMVSYYSWFASYGYCEDLMVPLFCCKDYLNFFTEKWTIVSESSTDKFYVYNYILWRSDEYKKYIIAFPGTNEILELLKEAVNIKLVDYGGDNGFQVVNYFKQVAFELKNLIFSEQVLKDIDAHPGYQIIATGHSLGASVAAIILYEAVSKFYIDPSINEPVLITFGQPRIGNEEFVLDFNKKIKNVIRVARDGDIVVSLPYSLINNPYRHLGGLVLVNKDMTSMTYCPKDIGEDYEDKECQKSTSLLFKYHTYYFNPDTKVSMRCYE